MYDVTTGRWTQTDPEQYIDGPDMYEFVSDDPTTMTDATGLKGAASQPTSQPTTQPGNTWDLLGPSGSLTQQFIDNYIGNHKWGQSGPTSRRLPPYDPCGDGEFRPRVGMNTRHDTLQIGNTRFLAPEQIQIIQDLIDQFNQVSADHEARMAQQLKDIYCGCSKNSGLGDWRRRLQAADALSSTSAIERNDLREQLLLLEQILNAAGIPIPTKLRNDLK